MNIVMDGYTYQAQASGGVSRIYNEIVPRMLELDENLFFELLTHGRLSQAPPKHPRLIHYGISRSPNSRSNSKYWQPALNRIQQVYVNWRIGDGRNKIWHPTYFAVRERWAGARVVTVYDMILERFMDQFNSPDFNLVRDQKKRAVLSSDIIICISETTRRDVQEFYEVDDSRLRVVYPACSAGFTLLDGKDGALKSCGSLPTQRPFILFVGKRREYKGFPLLVKAYAGWHQRSEFDLVLVGNPLTGEEKKMLDALKVLEKVHLLKGVSDEYLCCLYNQAAAFVYPSFFEGFGIPLLEAMSCGCPIVASSIPTTHEIARDFPYYFESGNADALMLTLDQAITDGRNPSRIKTGFQRVSHFSWEDNSQQTLQIYYELFRSL